MMAGFNILFLAVLCIALYLVFLLLWTGILLVFRRTRHIGYVLLSLPVYVLLLYLYIQYQSRPAVVFTRTFGFSPPADVSSLQSRQFFLGDGGSVYLHFTCNPATIGRITARGLAPATTQASISNDPDDRDAPPWWKPSPTPSTTYSGRFSNRKFATEVESLTYDPATNEAWFHFIGID